MCVVRWKEKHSPKGKQIARIHNSSTFTESVPNTDILLTSERIQNIREKPCDVMTCPFVPLIILTLGGFNLLLLWTTSPGTISVPQNPGFVLLKLCILLLFNNCVLKWTNTRGLKTMIQKKSSLWWYAFPKMQNNLLRNVRCSPNTTGKPLLGWILWSKPNSF